MQSRNSFDILAHRNFRFGRTVFRHIGQLDSMIDHNGIPGLLSVMQTSVACFDLDRQGFVAIGQKICPPIWRLVWIKLIDQFTTGDRDGLWEVDQSGRYRLSNAALITRAPVGLNEQPWMNWGFKAD